jgi:hypothetical protein
MFEQEPIQEVPCPNQGQITASLDSILVIYFCYTRQVPMTDRSFWEVKHLNPVHILAAFLRSILILSSQIYEVLSTLQVSD